MTAAELTEKAVYGLPELNGDRVANAALVANPGCYATSVILALAPLLKAGRGRSRARDRFRFEVGSVGSGQGADGEDAFCFGGRQSCRRIRFSITGTWARLSSNSDWARRS